jgi:hypothetical protein
VLREEGDFAFQSVGRSVAKRIASIPCEGDPRRPA